MADIRSLPIEDEARIAGTISRSVPPENPSPYVIFITYGLGPFGNGDSRLIQIGGQDGI